MCIMMTDHEPNTTKLYHVPVTYNNYPYNLCIYVNNLDMQTDSHNYIPYRNNRLAHPLSNLPNMGNVYNNHFQVIDDNFFSEYVDNKGALMIVPFPKVDGFKIGMVNIDTEEMKQFRQDVKNLFPSPMNKSFSLEYDSEIMMLSRNPLKVHSIGNYNISIAPDIDSLLNRINWNKFAKPTDYNLRVATLHNKSLYPCDCIYVVAQATKNVKDDGFGIIYPNVGFDYFPTAHEGSGMVVYDVECFHFMNEPEHHSNSSFLRFGNKKLPITSCTDLGSIERTLKKLSGEVTMEDGTTDKFKTSHVSRVNRWTINGSYNNKNIYIKNNKWK